MPTSQPATWEEVAGGRSPRRPDANMQPWTGEDVGLCCAVLSWSGVWLCCAVLSWSGAVLCCAVLCCAGVELCCAGLY